MKKLKVWALAGLAALLVVVGIGVPVMADDPTPTPTAPAVRERSLIDKVAKIIGVDSVKLVTAMKEAAADLRSTSPTPTPGTPRITRDAFLEKVAEKLLAVGVTGVTKDTLTAAFTQAANEMRTERIEAALQKAFEDGLITEAEKQEILDWYNNRPAALDKIKGFGWGWGGFRNRLGGFCKRWGWGRGGNPGAGAGLGGRTQLRIRNATGGCCDTGTVY